MKRLGKILFSITLICTLLIAYAVPVLAEEYDYRVETKDGEYYFYVNNGRGLKYVLEQYSNSSSTVHVVVYGLNVTEPIEISKGGNIYIETSSNEETKIYCTSEDKPLFTITADNTLLSFATKNIVIDANNKTEDGGAIYVDADDCIINGGHFRDCYAGDAGGAICVSGDNCIIWTCLFEGCVARYNGGGVFFCRGANGGIVGDCSFYDCDCGRDLLRDAAINITGNGDTLVGGYFTNTEPSLVECVLIEDKNAWRQYADAYWEMRARREKKEPAVTPYSRPIISTYARVAMDNNKQCDVIRPDMADTVKSDNGLFTLKGTNAYGALWDVTYKDPLTITAKEGYTIKRIEGIITEQDYYDELSIDKGKKKKSINNPYCNPFSKNYIAIFEDINAKSVTFTTKGNLKNYGTVHFSEFVIYYTKDTVAESASSGGSGGAAGIVTNSNDEDVMINNNDEGVVTNSNDDAILEGSTRENSDNNDAPDELDENYTGSSLSDGVLWIAIAIAVLAIAASTLVISRKKKGEFNAADDGDE